MISDRAVCLAEPANSWDKSHRWRSFGCECFFDQSALAGTGANRGWSLKRVPAESSTRSRLSPPSRMCWHTKHTTFAKHVLSPDNVGLWAEGGGGIGKCEAGNG